MNFVILGSGRGSNADAILRAWKNDGLGQARPVAVISDKADAPILALAKDYGVQALHIDPGPHKTKLSGEAEDRYVETIRSLETEFIVLAGFMRVLHRTFLDAFPRRIINLHPSLLPSFKGLHAIKQAWENGVKETGCTVHYVTGEVDGGPILEQKIVRIEKTDTLESLEEKIHRAEHQLLPAVIARLSEELNSST